LKGLNRAGNKCGKTIVAGKNINVSQNAREQILKTVIYSSSSPPKKINFDS